MLAELAGIQRNISKADRTDRKVQNLVSYINVKALKNGTQKEYAGKRQELSYGGQGGRKDIQMHKTNWVVEADIRGDLTTSATNGL